VNHAVRAKSMHPDPRENPIVFKIFNIEKSEFWQAGIKLSNIVIHYSLHDVKPLLLRIYGSFFDEFK
jgi:hypothetical protein